MNSTFLFSIAYGKTPRYIYIEHQPLDGPPPLTLSQPGPDNVSRAVPRASSSKVPKPSSRNSESTRTFLLAIFERPNAVAKDVFARNDHEVWSMLWKWAKRRHPKKDLRWIMDKYFHTRGGRKWMFIAEEADRKGERQLFLEASMPIRRHVKIRTKANPHDPVWREYFSARKEQMKKATLFGCRVSYGALLEA